MKQNEGGEAVAANFTTAEKENSVVRNFRTTAVYGIVVKDSFTTDMETPKE